MEKDTSIEKDGSTEQVNGIPDEMQDDIRDDAQDGTQQDGTATTDIDDTETEAGRSPNDTTNAEEDTEAERSPDDTTNAEVDNAEEDAPDADSQDGTSQNSEEDSEPAIVAISSDRIAEDLRSAAHLAADDDLRVLVMTRGRGARVPVNSLKNAGIYTITPAVGDRRYDAAPKLAQETAQLGTCKSPELFENAYAVLTCAKDCNARAIFLCEGSEKLADDERFLACAYHVDLPVYKAVGIDTPNSLGWVECPVPENSEELYESTSWRTCHECGLTFDESDFAARGLACPSCGTLTRMTSQERIDSTLDEGSFVEWDEDVPDSNPLDFPGYAEKLAEQRQKTGLKEAIRTGSGTIRSMPCAVGFMDSSFFMGSMGHVVGEKVARLFDRAIEENLPVIIFCASGGARMQEGLISLMQMAKTAAACKRHDRAGLLYVSVITDPTTGGVTASFATLADIILAEPRALIGFAGKRVIRDTIKQDLPKDFQTAEFALEHGLIDAIVERANLRDALANILMVHAPDAHERYASMQKHNWKDPLKPITVTIETKHSDKALSLVDWIPGLRNLMRPKPVDPERDFERQERREQRELRRAGITEEPEPGSAWESVQIARNVRRPTAQRYLDAVCESFIELHGDRAFADDAAIMAGIGWIEGKPVTIIAEEKGSDLNDRIRRNFGCPQPEGYRKSLRLLRQAEKFRRPVICFVDTQGAFCGTGAEERGQGNAIADNLKDLSDLNTQVISILIGEGGSGGALALAVADRVAMQEYAVYSVVSPEGCASILWKDRSRAPEAADAMRMGANDALAMGIIDEVISEGEGPAHENPDEAIANVCDYITRTLNEVCAIDPEEIAELRQVRFGKY